jgi:hypothetical protein
LLGQRRNRSETLWLVADVLPIVRDVGLQGRLCGQRRGLRARKARLSLRHVGAGDFADVETIARLSQLLLQHVDVIAV